jgi:uncharacterized membrane protein
VKPLSRLRTHLEASFWFVPAMILACSLAAAGALVEAESMTGWNPADWSPRLFGAGADGSRAMLSAIGTSMVTVAGVVFSITIVALSLTSTQYSPRVLRNFMRDRPTQVVLGVFVGIFAYCLVVLRTIRGGDEGAFIPSLAVLGGMVYALAGISLLVFFIHHVALSIQASSILARIAADTTDAINRMFPQDLGNAPESEEQSGIPNEWTPLPARRSGYVVAVDGDGLLGLAAGMGRVLRLEAQVGDFIAHGSPVAAASGLRPLEQAQADRVFACVEIGNQRTIQQDVAFGLQQLVDVALRAQSPGVNDPATACMCIDQLSGLLAQLGGRRLPGPMRMHQGKLQLVVRTPDFAAWLRLSLLPIALHARGDVSVLSRLVSAMELLAGKVQPWPARREALRPLSRELHRAITLVPSRQIARPLHGRLREMEKRLSVTASA